jgi:hypothetical protein
MYRQADALLKKRLEVRKAEYRDGAFSQREILVEMCLDVLDHLA